MTNSAHDHAHFFFSILELLELLHFDSNFVIWKVPERSHKLSKRHDRLVIDAAIQKTSLLFQNTNYLKRRTSNEHLLPNSRFAFKKISGYLVPDHANRSRSLSFRGRHKPAFAKRNTCSR